MVPPFDTVGAYNRFMRPKNILRALRDPLYLCEKLAGISSRRRRLARLHGTPAEDLSLGYVDSLELLELAKPLGIKTVYDIGANVGTWTLLCKSVIPEASVEAFEPLPKHLGIFKESLKGISGVTLHAIALGPQNTTADLHVTNMSDSTSMLPISDINREQFGLEETESVPTRVRRLDDYRQENNLHAPDLLKLDVQGYELEVLKGAEKCLHSAKAVITEVSFVRYYENQCLFQDLVSHLAQFDFSVAAFAVCTPVGSIVNVTDVLFLKRAGLKNGI